MIDAYATQGSYWRHLAPIVAALQARGHEVRTWSGTHPKPWGERLRRCPEPAPLALCASGIDAKALAPQRAVYVEHGAGQTYCLAPETKVLRSDLRWVPIRNLLIGDEVVAFDEFPAPKWRGWQTARVTQARTVVQPCYRLNMADGSTVIASADHLWLKANRQTYEWCRTDTLQDAARWPSRSSKLIKSFDPWEEERSWEAGYLAAAFDGEGCLTQTPRNARSNRLMLTFTQKQNAMLALVCRALDAYGFDYAQPKDDGRGVHHLTIRGGTPETLRFLGSIRPRRLLSNFVPLQVGQMRGTPVEVLRSEFIGEQEVVAVSTSTRTLFAEGFASHNCGQDGYAGMEGLDHVVLFLSPGEHVAALWRERYPQAAVESIGCPALDALAFRAEVGGSSPPTLRGVAQTGRADGGERGNPQDSVGNLRGNPSALTSVGASVVAITAHWRCFRLPETMPALPYFKRGLAELARLDSIEVIGHAHPRAEGKQVELWAELGVPFEPDPDAILATLRERAFYPGRNALLVADNTSLMYEAAALNIPVLALNSPRYRRDVEHGLRFWSHVPGIQCDSEATFLPAVMAALDDPPEAAMLRERAAAHVYAHRDGRSAERAADAIERALP